MEHSIDREKVMKGLELHGNYLADCNGCPYEDKDSPGAECCGKLCADALALLKEQEAVEPKTIPEELKLKMWNALYAVEDGFEKKYIGTKEQDSWFLIYRPWLQEGFNLTIKVIADWEGR